MFWIKSAAVDVTTSAILHAFPTMDATLKFNMYGELQAKHGHLLQLVIRITALYLQKLQYLKGPDL